VGLLESDGGADAEGGEGALKNRASARDAPTVTMNLRNYIVVTAAYWGFTLTDGALRMLVLLHFAQQGYSPVRLAMLFLFMSFRDRHESVRRLAGEPDGAAGDVARGVGLAGGGAGDARGA